MIQGPRHAHYVGWVWGLGLKHGLDIKPMVDDEGDYTDRLVVTFPGERSVTLVVPPPPPEWVPFPPTNTGESNE